MYNLKGLLIAQIKTETENVKVEIYRMHQQRPITTTNH